MTEATVRVSTRARRPRVLVHPDRRVEVVLPPRAPRGTAERLLREHGPWIDRQLARLAPRLELRPLSEREGRHQARERLTGVCEREAARLGVRYARIRIADQRTRWGSCSRSGTLSFNWRLVLAPQPVLEYVAVHELCHLVEPSHSPRFWALVERARPSFPDERRWLREHGHELLAYRPSAGGGTAFRPR
ncbi:MAG TPA: SprT family zinc-dependent metalloprotease [Gaiellaceae bacterium]|nr:SprT family zinc-dependent metalloprotease [Gaiellaceae bacterium]